MANRGGVKTFKVVKGFNVTDKDGKEKRVEADGKKTVQEKDFDPKQWKALVRMEAVEEIDGDR